MNDCGAADDAQHCAGQAPGDGMVTEWVYVPEDTCEKLAGNAVHGSSQPSSRPAGRAR